jgi:hypothetical protein
MHIWKWSQGGNIEKDGCELPTLVHPLPDGIKFVPSYLLPYSDHWHYHEPVEEQNEQ